MRPVLIEELRQELTGIVQMWADWSETDGLTEEERERYDRARALLARIASEEEQKDAAQKDTTTLRYKGEQR